MIVSFLDCMIDLDVTFKEIFKAEVWGSLVDLGVMVWWTDTDIYLLRKT